MFSYGPWFRLARVAFLLLMVAGMLFPAAAQARPFEEAPPALGAEPASLVDRIWEWVAAAGGLVNLFGEEGWGMDPNGGKAAVRPDAPMTDRLP